MSPRLHTLGAQDAYEQLLASNGILERSAVTGGSYAQGWNDQIDAWPDELCPPEFEERTCRAAQAEGTVTLCARILLATSVIMIVASAVSWIIETFFKS